MKTRSTALLIGGIVGALLGMLVAWILIEEEEGTDIGPGGAARRKLAPKDAINLALGTISVVRQIAALRHR